MHDHLKQELVMRRETSTQTQVEIHLGQVIQAAIESGFAVSGLLFADYHFIE
jgi:hypothetical protein